ncbi:MAG: site-specific DNA-methyltransferase [Anaerolineales bacterium]|nr:site-specific DNA-methyltransferase [Anaerolineales bacterium]
MNVDYTEWQMLAMKNSKKITSSSKTKTKRLDRSTKTTKPARSAVSVRSKHKKADSSVAAASSSLSAMRLPQNDKPRNETRVEIKPAKGRPMLTWVGKKPLRHAIAYPAQLVETFHASPSSPSPRAERRISEAKPEVEAGLLFHGDNKDVLAYLLANGFRGKVKLIYIDPPFDSGADYIRKVSLRSIASSKPIEADSYTLGEQIQYTDIWANDNYLQFMYERLQLLRELLAEDGNIFLHCDWRMVHRLRLLLDEIFSADNFVNEIAWKHTVLGGTHGRRLPKAHETILWYGKSQDYFFNNDAKSARVEFGDYIKKTLRQDEDGRWYYTRGRMSRQPSLDELERKAFTRTYVDDPSAGTLASDIWDDLLAYRVYGDENADYPTQKNETVIERCVDLGSEPGDLVLDCFLGSGTTAAVAQKLGRRWIGADINKGAIQTTVKRLQGVMQERADLTPQPPLLKEMGSETPPPAQLGFAVYRVNDYDLQIQHNEAFNLAVEHLGMTRTKTDTFFDGTLGKKLVKITPFNHPITALDLEEVKNELNVRPEEERDIVVVGLGKEYAVDAWLEEWNKLRRKDKFPNRIEVIELRSDPKYGGFFTHEPAQAKVSFRVLESDGSPSKKRGKTQEQAPGLHNRHVEITIDDFISPTILERLKQQNKDNPLFQPQVSDWRSMVDSVMIDADYGGKVFNITLADVPERKNDLVQGKYVVEAKRGTTIAVKVTDMLGEEVLILS